jgi:hypothetical protein
VGVLIAWAALVSGASPAGAAATHPAGYTIVQGSLLAAPPGAFDAGGHTECPTGTVVWGGGVFFQGFGGPTDSIEVSEPEGTAGWEGRVNNTGSSSTGFVIDAVCANKPTAYKTVFKTVDNAAATTAATTVVCPTGTVVLSGGVLSTADVTTVDAISMWAPGKTKFRGVMWNGSGSDAKLTVLAVCAKQPPGYAIVRFTVAVDPGVTDISGATCPSGTSVISGGVKEASPTPAVPISANDVNTAHNWTTVVTNTTTAAMNVQSSAICAS